MCLKPTGENHSSHLPTSWVCWQSLAFLYTCIAPVSAYVITWDYSLLVSCLQVTFYVFLLKFLFFSYFGCSGSLLHCTCFVAACSIYFPDQGSNPGPYWECRVLATGPTVQFSSVQFSRSIMSVSLQFHGLQHSRLPCPSPTPGSCSNSCPSSR